MKLSQKLFKIAGHIEANVQDVKKKLKTLSPTLKLKLRRLSQPNDLARQIAAEFGMKKFRWQERYVSIEGIPGGAIDVAGKVDGILVTISWLSEWDIFKVEEGDQVG